MPIEGVFLVALVAIALAAVFATVITLLDSLARRWKSRRKKREWWRYHINQKPQ
jgi:hypothetical protein